MQEDSLNNRHEKLFMVVTTIQAPTDCMVAFGKKWPGRKGSLLIVGDSKGPFEYSLPNSRLLSIEDQRRLDYNLAKILPEKHYARKNLGYLSAMEEGAAIIYETDDDNGPLDHWAIREIYIDGFSVNPGEWYNVYQDFSDEIIWPRGLPLNQVNQSHDSIIKTRIESVYCPLQQGLADHSPDVDAVWRLILDKDIRFADGESILLKKGTWCPFNSQSTWWWPEAYPLMYLPSLCPFRMTDIWRSFVAQRCLWELGYELVFHKSEVYQNRNPHDPMLDFKDEVSGYLRNQEIKDCLEALDLKSGDEYCCENLLMSYEALVKIGIVPEAELPLVEAWMNDIKTILKRS
ncbi:MAG: STELLO glycosyltransferase family protein [Opitutales bacterium]|nr:STELLO glycosyltransferase family protein [Opitutales bacterium]